MKKLLLISLFIFFTICSKSWAEDCYGSPKVNSSTVKWNNCKGTWTNNDFQYTGGFKNGLYHGEGIATLRNGDKYEGSFISGSYSGYGIFSWANGDIYLGNWSNNQRNGHGILFLMSPKFKGQVYVGNWKDEAANGLGTFYWQDGNIYVGNFINNNIDGNGTQFETNGKIFKGVWKNWKWVSGTEVTNTYTGYFPDPKPFLDNLLFIKKQNKNGTKYNSTKKYINKNGNNNTNNNSNASNTTKYIYTDSAKNDKTNFDNAKKECEEIGFKKGTEKFGECVLDLTE